jgi:hypothetical protein
VSIINIDHAFQCSAILAQNPMILNFGNDRGKIFIAVAEQFTRNLPLATGMQRFYHQCIAIARKIMPMYP